MRISGDFTGGNIQVLSIEGDTVRLDNELRDTGEDWFYWAFRVEGAQGRTLRFTFGEHRYVGYWGAAVSSDRKNWRWSEGANRGGTEFTYTFGEDETDLYFAHDMNYTAERFGELAEEKALPVSVLTRSEGGRDVPMVRLGTEGPTLLLTSRHHCCESTGTYLMEGFLREFAEHPPRGFRVLAIPFMDIDGVVNGDQGKGRRPHDHNRDYIDHPVWKSTAALMALIPGEQVRWHFDLHAPGIDGHEHDFAYMLCTPENNNPTRERFRKLLDEETYAHREAFPFVYDFAFGSYISNPGSCVSWVSRQPGVELAATIETTYAGNYEHRTSVDNLIALGRCAARALRTIAEY